MQAMDQQVLGKVGAWLAADRRVWLCTILETYGSSPRPAGSLLACCDNGELAGSLSGGCVEDDLIEQLQAGSLATSGPEIVRYGLAPEDTEKLGLPCGGHLEVAIEPLHPDQVGLFRAIAEQLENRQCVRRSASLDHADAMSIESLPAYAPLQLLEGATGERRLLHTYGPQRQLFLIGAGMVSRYLAEMAQALDYQVTVCDPRSEMLESWQLAGTRTLCLMPDDAVREYADDPATAIIALTHDPRIDDMGLMEALRSRAFYVGAMGSKRTSASRRERLAQLDLTPSQIERLHAPVGLPIGSKTPPEIAIAILAELTALNGSTRQVEARPSQPAVVA